MPIIRDLASNRFVFYSKETLLPAQLPHVSRGETRDMSTHCDRKQKSAKRPRSQQNHFHSNPRKRDNSTSKRQYPLGRTAMVRLTNSLGLLVYGVPIVVYGVPIVGAPLIQLSSQETVTFVVEKAERVVNRNDEGAKYLVFTEEETFENTDSLLFGKFNSSDVYGKLKEGHAYQAKVAGARVPLMSWYRNIITVEELDAPDDAL